MVLTSKWCKVGEEKRAIMDEEVGNLKGDNFLKEITNFVGKYGLGSKDINQVEDVY